MSKSNTALTSEQQERIEQAIAQAASRTGAEIIPVISHSSGRYDRAEDLVGLWAAAVGLVLTWLILSLAPIGNEFAVQGNISGAGLVPVLGAVIIGFGVGAVIATKIGALRKLFIPKASMAGTVSDRAKQYFADYFIKGSNHGNAMLIYVSLYEKDVRLLTSDKLKGRLSTVELESIRSDIKKSISSGKVVDGVCAAVARTAELLAPHCPPKSVESERRSYVNKIVC